MWQAVGEVAVDVLMPTGQGPDLDRLFDKKNPNLLRVPLIERDAFTRRLNQSGWFDEEIVAAGLLTQGRPHSLTSMVTGWALVELARARRAKSLPREFCVAVTADRVFVLALSAWSEGGEGQDVVVKVKREELGSWSRGSVRIDLDGRKHTFGQKGGMLDLAGVEQVPVNWELDSSDAVVELLARA
jgi:hypothetical protein